MLPNTTLIIEILSFLILLFVMKRLLYKPLLDFLDKRAKSIEESINKTREDQQVAKKELDEAKKHLEDSKKEALALKDLAKKDADSTKRDLLRNAKFETERMREYAKEDLAKEAKRVRKELKKEIAELSIKISEKLLAKKVNRNLSEKIIKEGVEELR